MHTLDAIVFPYLVVVLLWVVIAFFVVSIAALFVGLGIHKRHLAKRESNYRRQIEAYAHAISQFREGDETCLPSVADFDAACALGAALTKTFRTQDIPPQAALLEAIRNSGAALLVMAYLDAKDWGQRFRAVTALGDLRLPELFDKLVEIAHSEPHMSVFGNCLYAAANSVSRPDQIRTLFDLINSRRDISAGYDEGMFRLAIQALRRHDAQLEALAAVLRPCLQSEEADEQHLLALVLAMGKEQLVAFKNDMVNIVRSRGSARLTAAVMRAVHSMHLCDSIISEYVGSSDPMLNIAAIRSAECCGPDIVPLIGRELRSTDFNVRYAAAVTLSKLGENGHNELIERRQDSDPFARDMAAFALSVG